MNKILLIGKDIGATIKSLPEKQQDILTLRFGFNGQAPSTLSNIGKKYGITRERVRQIQNNGLAIIRESKDFKRVESYLHDLKSILADHGNIMAEKHIIPVFLKDCLGIDDKKDIDSIKKTAASNIVFLLNLGDEFKESKRTQEFNKFWFTEKEIDSKIKSILKQFIKRILEEKNPLKRDELYTKLAEVLRQEYKREASINEIKSILNISRQLKRNPLNQWGYYNWSEISPKNAGDQAFLAISASGKPLHFNEIPETIFKLGIKKTKPHGPTVHNVLIKDPRFVLIGKGKYALAKWGYINGTVIDLIKHYLKQNGGSMDKEALIQEILKQKDVKRSTILLNIGRDSDLEDKDGRIKLLKE